MKTFNQEKNRRSVNYCRNVNRYACISSNVIFLLSKDTLRDIINDIYIYTFMVLKYKAKIYYFYSHAYMKHFV